MGKYLAIKTANFSNVAVSQVTPTPIGGEVELTPVQLSDLAISEQGVVITISDWKVYYVPITSGKTYHLQIVWSTKHYQRVGTSASIPALNTALSMLVNQNGGDQYSTATLDYTFTAQSNGYLAWQMHVADTVSCEIIES